MSVSCIVSQHPTIIKIRDKYKHFTLDFVDSHIIAYSKTHAGKIDYDSFVKYFNKNVINKPYFKEIIEDYGKRFDNFTIIENEYINGRRIIDIQNLDSEDKNKLISALYVAFPPICTSIMDDKIVVTDPRYSMKQSDLIREIYETSTDNITKPILSDIIDLAKHMGFEIHNNTKAKTFVDCVNKIMNFATIDEKELNKARAMLATQLMPVSLYNTIMEWGRRTNSGRESFKYDNDDLYNDILRHLNNNDVFQDRPFVNELENIVSIDNFLRFKNYFETLISKAAFDITYNKSGHYNKFIAKGFNQKRLNLKTLSRSSAYFIYKALTDIGAGLDGSAAVRMQGSLFRAGDEDFHDLDFTMKYDSLSWKIRQELDKQFEAYKMATNNFQNKDKDIWRSIYATTKKNVEQHLKSSKLYNELLKYYTSVTVHNVFQSGDSLCLTLNIEGFHVDVFYQRDVLVKNINGIKVTDFSSAFKAKLQMAREKDIRDIINFQKYVPVELDRTYTIYELKNLYFMLNPNPEDRKLVERIFDVADQMKLKISFTDIFGRSVAGRYTSKGQILLNYDYFSEDSEIDNLTQANSMLHELMHAVTMYAVSQGRAAQSSRNFLTQKQRDAVKDLNNIYEQLKDNPKLQGEYGVSGFEEFVAELQNQQFRDKIKSIDKEQSFWKSILNAILRFFGFSINSRITEDLNDLIQYNDAYSLYVNSQYLDVAYMKKDVNIDNLVNDLNKNTVIFQNGDYVKFNEVLNFDNYQSVKEHIQRVVKRHFGRNFEVKVSIDASLKYDQFHFNNAKILSVLITDKKTGKQFELKDFISKPANEINVGIDTERTFNRPEVVRLNPYYGYDKALLELDLFENKTKYPEALDEDEYSISENSENVEKKPLSEEVKASLNNLWNATYLYDENHRQRLLSITDKELGPLLEANKIDKSYISEAVKFILNKNAVVNDLKGKVTEDDIVSAVLLNKIKIYNLNLKGYIVPNNELSAIKDLIKLSKTNPEILSYDVSYMVNGESSFIYSDNTELAYKSLYPDSELNIQKSENGNTKKSDIDEISDEEKNVNRTIKAFVSKIRGLGIKVEDNPKVVLPLIRERIKDRKNITTDNVDGFYNPKTKTIYLNVNAKNFNPSKPLHEFTHIWDGIIAHSNKLLWKKGVTLMKKDPLWKEIEDSEDYGKRWKELKKEQYEYLIASEVHSRLVEQHSDELILKTKEKKGLLSELFDWLVDFFKSVQKICSFLIIQDLDKITLEDFVKLPLKDLIDNSIELRLKILDSYNKDIKKHKKESSNIVTVDYLSKATNAASVTLNEELSGITIDNDNIIIGGDVELDQPLTKYIKEDDRGKFSMLLKMNSILNDDEQVDFDMSIQDLYDDYTMTRSSLKNEARDEFYNRIMDFKKNTPLTNEKLNFLMKYLTARLGTFLYQLKNDKNVASHYTDKDLSSKTYGQIINIIGHDKIFDVVRRSLVNWNDVSERLHIIKNIDNIIYLASKNIQRSLYINIQPDFNSKVDGQFNLKVDDIDNIELNDDVTDEAEEQELEHYLIKDSFTVDNYAQISMDMKSFLNSLIVIDSEGNQQHNEQYGVLEYLDGQEAYKILSKLLSPCQTIDEMISVLDEQTINYPWIRYIYNKSGINLPLYGTDSKIDSDPTFRAQFFQSFSTTTYLHTSMYTTPNGRIISFINNKVENDQISDQKLDQFIFKGGIEDFIESVCGSEVLQYVQQQTDDNGNTVDNSYVIQSPKKQKDTLLSPEDEIKWNAVQSLWTWKNSISHDTNPCLMKNLKGIYQKMLYLYSIGDLENFYEVYDKFNTYLYKGLRGNDPSTSIKPLAAYFNQIGLNLSWENLSISILRYIDRDAMLYKQQFESPYAQERFREIEQYEANRNNGIPDDDPNQIKLAVHINQLGTEVEKDISKFMSNSKFVDFENRVNNILKRLFVGSGTSIIFSLTTPVNVNQNSYQKEAKNFIKQIKSYSNDFQLVFYQNGKLRYAQQFPSFLTNLVNLLRGDRKTSYDEYVQSLIKQYGDDEYFFKKGDGHAQFHNNLLRQLADPIDGYDVRLRIEHHTFGDRDGKSYKDLEDNFFSTYFFRYFGHNASNDTMADYKLSIFSDKPVMEFLTLPRISLQSKIIEALKILTNKALSTADKEQYLKDNFVNGQELVKAIVRKGTRINGVVAENDMFVNVWDIISKDFHLTGGSKFAQKQLVQQFYNVFIQEIILIRRAIKRAKENKLSQENYDIQDYNPDYSTRDIITKNIGTAASFSYLTFFNDEILNNKSRIGQTIIDFIDGKLSITENEFASTIKNKIFENINKQCEDFIDHLVQDGFIKDNLSSFKELGYGYISDPTSDNVFITKPNFTDEQIQNMAKSAIRDYFWNNKLQQINITQLTTVTPAFYSDAIAVQKRAAQFHAYGEQMNKDAVWNGQPVTDGNFRAIIIKDEVIKSKSYDDFANFFMKKTGVNSVDELPEEYKIILHELEGINTTDGQALMSPSSLRKKLIMLNQWSAENEEIYKDIMSNPEKYLKNTKALSQVLKPLVYGFQKHDQMYKPYQFKNSEYCLLLCHALMNAEEGQFNKSKIIYDFIEDSYKRDSITGIDTVEYESCSKISNDFVIDLSYEAVLGFAERNSIYDINEAGLKYLQFVVYKNNKYNEDYVKTMDYNSYKLQQKTTPHFQDHRQAEGSQNRVLSISDIDPKETAFINGKEVEAKKLIDRYNDINKTIYRKLAQSFKRKFRLQSLTLARQKISEVLKDMISTDAKVNFDLFTTVSINPETLRFEGDVNDPLIVRKIVSCLLSYLKKEVAKSEYPGGPIVQVSSSVIPNQPKAVFLDKEGKPSKNPKDSERFGYYEVYVTIPDSKLEKDLTKPDGTLMTVDEAVQSGLISDESLYVLCTRIPSEAKYSTLPCKIVGFLPSTMGEAIIAPPELVTFTGADFDIDKLYSHIHALKKINGKWQVDRAKGSIEALMNELLDIRFALYTMPSVAEQCFTPGNFDTLKMQNRAVLLNQMELESGKPAKYDITRRGIIDKKTNQKQSLKQLDSEYKSKTSNNKDKQIDDLNQIYYYNQNLTDTISIFAKAVSAHAAMEQMQHKVVNLPLNFVFGSIQYQNKFNQTTNDKAGKLSSNLITDTDTGKQLGPLELDQRINFDGELTNKMLAEGVGASADKAKFPALYALNINSKTINVYMLMIRLGFNKHDIINYLSSPVMKVITSVYTGDPYYDSKMLKSKGLTMSDSTRNININLSHGELNKLWAKESNLKSVNSNLVTQAYVFYSMLYEFSRVVQNIDQLTTLNSYSKAVGTDLQSNNEYQNILYGIAHAVKAGWLSTSFLDIIKTIGIPGYIYQALYGGGFHFSLSSQLFSDFIEKNEQVAQIEYISKNLGYDFDIFKTIYKEMITDQFIDDIVHDVSSVDLMYKNVRKDTFETVDDMLLSWDVFTSTNNGERINAFLKFLELKAKAISSPSVTLIDDFWRELFIEYKLESDFNEDTASESVTQTSPHFRISIQENFDDSFKQKMSSAIEYMMTAIADESLPEIQRNDYAEQYLLVKMIMLNAINYYGIGYNQRSPLLCLTDTLKSNPNFIWDKVTQITRNVDEFSDKFKYYFQLNVIKNANKLKSDVLNKRQDNGYDEGENTDRNQLKYLNRKWALSINHFNLVGDNSNENAFINVTKPSFVRGVSFGNDMHSSFRSWGQEQWFFRQNNLMPLVIFGEGSTYILENIDENQNDEDNVYKYVNINNYDPLSFKTIDINLQNNLSGEGVYDDLNDVGEEENESDTEKDDLPFSISKTENDKIRDEINGVLNKYNLCKI